MVGDRRSGKLAVILHADIAGSTALVQQDERLAHERIQETFHRFSDTITQYHGRVRELRGDALLAEFERASDAVTAALALQSDQSRYNGQFDDDIQPSVRVGIAMGEVIIADNTVTGTGVVLAQRVEQLAEPGGVVIQGASYETIPGRFPFVYADLGEYEVKGFDKPVRAYSASLRSEAAIPEPEKVDHRLRNTLVALASVSVIATGIALMWFKPWEQREEPASVKRMAFPLPDKPSIAVLPFNNMSDDPQQEYFVDGITEDLITDLSQLSGLFVIARNSVFTYKGKAVKVRQVAEELGVRYVMEGSVRRVNSQVRINAQLIDATTGGHLWAKRYDGSLDDVFALQDQVTEQIVSALALNLIGGDTTARPKTTSTQAYDAFLKGWAHYQRHTVDDLTRAIPYLEQAIQLDSDYAQAQASLAAVYWEVWSNSWAERMSMSPVEAMSKAKQHLRKAMKEATPLAHWVASNIAISEGNYQNAVSEAEQIIALDSNNPAGYAQLASALEVTGKDDKSLIEKAVRLDPYSSPLHTAAKNGDADTVRQLIGDGANIDAKDYYSKTALHYAAENGHENIAQLLIESDADIEAKANTIGLRLGNATPLHLAASHGHMKVATLLVEAGANIEARTVARGQWVWGWTPLIVTASTGHENVTQMLISAGADVNARGTSMNQLTVLHYAADSGQTGVAELLIANGADIDATSARRLDTPMSWAAKMGHKAMTELLIRKGANVNAKNAWGSTPLHEAVISGDFDIVQLLIVKGADISAKTVGGAYPGDTPLHIAAFAGHTQIAELLLTNGANVDAPNQFGHTPLRRTIDQGHLEMAELLINKGASVATKDPNGVTLLHAVAYTDNVMLAELLITEGAEINAKDNNSGFTPLDYAQDGEIKMIEALERHGAICTSC